MGVYKSFRRFGKKAAIMVSVLGLLGFSNAIADTKGERIEGSRPIESVDSIILENAAKSKTVMFGDANSLPEDSEYVIRLLPRLRGLGFSYFGLEFNKEPKSSHSRTLLKLIQDYKKGSSLNLDDYDGAPPGWVELTKAALDLGFEVVPFDEYYEDVGGYGTPRNKTMLYNLKERIFDKDPDARVIIYTGTWHCSEKPIYRTDTGKIEETLGYLLERYTEGRNYSVALIYDPYWEEEILTEGLVDFYNPVRILEKTSGKLSKVFDLDLSEHTLK